MRVAICESFGGSHALRIAQMPEPALEAGQVQVDVHAAAGSGAQRRVWALTTRSTS